MVFKKRASIVVAFIFWVRKLQPRKYVRLT